MTPKITTRGAVRINLGSVVFWPFLFFLSFAAAMGGGAYVVWGAIEREGETGIGTIALVMGGLVAWASWKVWRSGTGHLLIDVPAGMIHYRAYGACSSRLADLNPYVESYKDVARVTTTMYRVLGHGLPDARLMITPYEETANRFLSRLRDYIDDAAIREILAASGRGEGPFRDPDVPRRIRECVPDDSRRQQALARLAHDHNREIRTLVRALGA